MLLADQGQGDTDLAVPYLAVKRNLQAIKWDDSKSFNSKLAKSEDTYKPLKLGADGPTYGDYVRYSRLTYARIRGAGHMPNEKKPAESKDLIMKWLLDYDNSFKP